MYSLPTSALLLLKYVGSQDTVLIQDIWRQLVEQSMLPSYLSNLAALGNEGLKALKEKIETLGPTHYGHTTWPTAFLVRLLEGANQHLQLTGANKDEDCHWVYQTMTNVRVPFPVLFNSYYSLFDRVRKV